MERDADFDDDGLSTMTITVKAGNVTQTRTITFEVKNPINLVDVQLDRAAGEPTGDITVPGDLDFNLFTHDQFHNLAGDQDARITDDSTVADIDTDADFGETRSDFTTSGVGIRAFSDAPTVQTLTASLTVEKNLVSASDDPIETFETAIGKSDPINWVKGADVTPQDHQRWR